ncbi:hypothetical protein [Methylocella sp.]|jgi:hypothetical protein|uniref:hypothetical protein n=1 Tax=Methylocella sp. TaxID=1978226 RepID=UPI003C7508A9
MIAVASHVKVGGPVCQGVSAVVEAIDGLAAVLTGEKDYFHGAGTWPPKGKGRRMKTGWRGSAERSRGRNSAFADHGKESRFTIALRRLIYESQTRWRVIRC